MAIYHLRTTNISRSQGRSATAAAAYRVAERITDRRTGLVFDYAAKAGVEHAEILAPSHAPDWVSDRSELWNRVEEAERRRDSRVAREVRVALPSELSHAERVELVRDYVRDQFVDQGMVADVAWHAPGRDGDERNHHAHILLTTRELGTPGEDGTLPDGFGKKATEWNRVEALEGWRAAWARDVNLALERHGHEARVDHRTLEAQRAEALELAASARERGEEEVELRETVRAVELDRPPLPQLSAGAWHMKERGIEVGRVAAWHEAKERAAEVRAIAAGLAREVGAWIAERAASVAERVRGLSGPEHQGELALAGGGRGEPEGDRRDLAIRLREAWGARQGAQERTTEVEGLEAGASPPDERHAREEAQGLAAGLRSAFASVDRDAFSERVGELTAGREAEERQAELEAAREQELARERAREIEAEDIADRLADRGPSHGL
ncbi:MAG: MobQ family relaxase [Shimia sp.]